MKDTDKKVLKNLVSACKEELEAVEEKLERGDEYEIDYRVGVFMVGAKMLAKKADKLATARERTEDSNEHE